MSWAFCPSKRNKCIALILIIQRCGFQISLNNKTINNKATIITITTQTITILDMKLWINIFSKTKGVIQEKVQAKSIAFQVEIMSIRNIIANRMFQKTPSNILAKIFIHCFIQSSPKILKQTVQQFKLRIRKSKTLCAKLDLILLWCQTGSPNKNESLLITKYLLLCITNFRFGVPYRTHICFARELKTEGF